MPYHDFYPSFSEAEIDPIPIDVGQILEEVEACADFDNGGTLWLTTKPKVKIKIPIRPKTEREPYEVDHIAFGNPATVVHWKDGTKTVVKCQKGEEWNAYTAFCAALAKKVYKTNAKVCDIVEKKDEKYILEQKNAEKQKKIEERKAAEAKAHGKRIKRMAKRMKEQEEAAHLASGRTENCE